jgi:hypothetical protein
MHEQELHTRHLCGGQGSTTYQRLVTYRNKPKHTDVDASSFNGKRMHLTEMNAVVHSKKGLGDLFNGENRKRMGERLRKNG